MASFLKKIFGGAAKESTMSKPQPHIPQPESPESIIYWENELENTIPQDIINRGIIESAFKGNTVHQTLVGLAFLPFSKENAKTWLEKASKGRDTYPQEVLAEMTKADSNKYILIWWSTKDFTNIIGSPRISILNRVTDMTLNKVVYRNVILVPFHDEIKKYNLSSDHFEYIRDHIDSQIIPNSLIICEPLAETEEEDFDLEELFNPENHNPQDHESFAEDGEFDIDKFFSDDSPNDSNSSNTSVVEAMKTRLKKKK